MIVMNAEVVVDRPARQVWALVADYGRDPQWRAGVATMDPSPPGPVVPGTVTAEILRVGGRTYRSAGAGSRRWSVADAQRLRALAEAAPDHP